MSADIGSVMPYGQQPGPRAMAGIATILAAICPAVKTLDVGLDPDRADGWDAADALEDGWGFEAFEKWAAPRSKIFAQTPFNSADAAEGALQEASATGGASNGDSATKPTITELDGGGKIAGFSPKRIGQLVAEYKNGGGLKPDWVWEGYLPAGGLGMLAGSPKVGKTTLAAHIAGAVVSGRDFLGHRTRKTEVLWLGLEERGQDVARRFDSLGASTVFYDLGPFRATPEKVPELAAWIKENSVGLVIVDTLSKFWDLKDENDAAGMERAVDPILRLARDTGAAVLLLHHTRKTPADDGSDIRGSSVLFGSLDVGIIFRSMSGGKNNSRRVLKSFSRYSETPTHLEAEFLEDGTWVRAEHSSDETADTSNHNAALLAALRAEPEDVSTIAERAALTNSTARRELRELLKTNPAVRKTGGGKKGDPEKFYALQEAVDGEMPPPPAEPLGVAESAAQFQANGLPGDSDGVVSDVSYLSPDDLLDASEGAQ